MNILDLVVLDVPCARCGRTYEVTATDVLRSKDMLAADCAVGNDERECVPLHFAELLDAAALDELQRAWARIEALGALRGVTPRIRAAAVEARAATEACARVVIECDRRGVPLGGVGHGDAHA